MDTGELSKRVRKLEKEVLRRTGGIIEQPVVLFDTPETTQTSKIAKDDGATVTVTVRETFDNQARAAARRLLYTQLQSLTGTSVAGASSAVSLRLREYQAYPVSENFMERRVQTWSDGSGAYYYGGNLAPLGNNKNSLGLANSKWTQVYATSGSIETSDADAKADIADVDEALMRAWGRVSFKVFRFREAKEAKGSGARLHVGVIAQEVMAAFQAEGLDASNYGLFCYDEWPEEWEAQEDGSRVKIRDAGKLYGIRYSEALALECAYQRWCLSKLEEKMASIS